MIVPLFLLEIGPNMSLILVVLYVILPSLVVVLILVLLLIPVLLIKLMLVLAVVILAVGFIDLLKSFFFRVCVLLQLIFYFVSF